MELRTEREWQGKANRVQAEEGQVWVSQVEDTMKVLVVELKAL